MEIKTEADCNDISECPRSDLPSTGMFDISDCNSVVFERVVCCLHYFLVVVAVLPKPSQLRDQ